MDRERERIREWGRGVPYTEYSIFIENIPFNYNPIQLERAFSNFGIITDIYIPRKLATKTKRKFGFVRYKRKEDAHRAMRSMNGRYLNHHKIFVAWAKYQKNGWKQKPYQQRHYKEDQHTGNFNSFKQKKIWVPKPRDSTTSVIRMSQEDSEAKENMFEVEGEDCDVMEEKMRRSLVCITAHPMEPSSLVNMLVFELPSCVKVTDMGLFKFILTFESKEEADHILSNYKDFLMSWFDDVLQWTEEETCETRRTWIEITGTPGHDWSRENIKKIAECWGEFVCLDWSTEQATSFSVARVLIDTTQLSSIHGQAILRVKSKGFRTFISEAKGSVNPFKSAPTPSTAPQRNFFSDSDAESKEESANSYHSLDQQMFLDQQFPLGDSDVIPETGLLTSFGAEDELSYSE